MGSVAWGDAFGSAWGDSWGAATQSAPVVATDPVGGGYIHRDRARSRKQYLRRLEEIERDLRGEVPEPVAVVVAQTIVEKFDASAEAREEALLAAMERQNLAYRAEYLEVMRRELRELRRRDDEEAILLLH